MRFAIDARAAAEVPAGRGRYVRELLNAFARSQHDHEFILWARRPWAEASLDERFRWAIRGAPTLLWPVVVGGQMSRDADACLASTSYLMTATWRRPGAAIVWDFAPFDQELGAPRGAGFERATIRLALRRARRLVAISEATRAELLRRFPGAPPVVVAPPAADARFSAEPHRGDRAAAERLGVADEFVLVTGTLEPRKNLPRLVRAYAGLPESVRAGRKLVVVGATGWETDETFSVLREHAATTQVLGYVSDDDLAALYRLAHVFCYVSLYEGFGIPVLEAMSCGTPVVTSSVSSMPEVGGDACLYVDPLNIEDIRRGLTVAMTDESERERMIRRGLERATAYSWDATGTKVLETLVDLASPR